MNVLITRAMEQLADTVNIFSATQSLTPFCMPMISFKGAEPAFKYDYYDYCLLTSPTAVMFFPADTVKAGRFIAVGEKTAHMITALTGAENILVPKDAYMDSILEMLKGEDLKNKRILSPGAEARIKDPSEFFKNAGAEYEEVSLYTTLPVKYGKNEIDNFIAQYKIDVVTFFSPSAVDAFFSQAGGLCTLKVAAIGKSTAAALEKYGLSSICPERQTAESMAEMLIK